MTDYKQANQLALSKLKFFYKTKRIHSYHVCIFPYDFEALYEKQKIIYH